MSILDSFIGQDSVLNLFSDKVVKVEPPQFYCHINSEDLSIVAIAPHPPLSNDSNDTVVGIKIDHDLAINFITGVENVYKWVVLRDADTFLMKHEDELAKEKLERLKALPIFELVEDTPYPDIRVVVNDPDHEGSVLVYYNGETIYNWSKPAKIYFTCEDDASYLKCAFALSAAVLDKIILLNKLDEWPNPIIIPIDDADDISVFSARSNHTIAIFRHDT